MKVYNYKNGEIAIFENNEKINIENYRYFVSNQETNRLFVIAKQETSKELGLSEYVEPSVKSVLSFADNNKCEMKIFEKEINGMAFKIEAYYINNLLKEIVIFRNGTRLIGYANNDINKGAIESVKNQLGLEF